MPEDSSSEVGNLFSRPPTGPAGHALKYLDAMVQRGEWAIRMDFLRIAGSGAHADRWIGLFLREGLIVEDKGPDGSIVYRLTEKGKRLHQTLKDHSVVKFVVEHLSGRRLKL